MALSTTTLVKQPAEERFFTMPFDNKMEKGESISTLDSVTFIPNDTSLSYDTQVLNSQSVDIKFINGTNKTTYKVTITVTTSTGQKLENEGFLEISDI